MVNCGKLARLKKSKPPPYTPSPTLLSSKQKENNLFFHVVVLWTKRVKLCIRLFLPEKAHHWHNFLRYATGSH